MAVSDIEVSRPFRRRFGVSVFTLFVGLVVVWVGAYLVGVWPWLGYAWMKRETVAAGSVGIVGEDSAGTELGLTTFFFVKGQTVVIDYDTDIRAGSLRFYVYDVSKSGQGVGASHYVTETEWGVWAYPVPKTGLYRISIGPSVVEGVGGGYDLSYRVWWGARWR